MHNKHQKLIDKKVAELIEKVRALNGVSALKIEKRFEYQQGYQDATTMFYIHLTGTPKTKGMMQDTIDTVLEEEMENTSEFIAAIANGTAFDPETGLIWSHWLEEAKRIYALDKTPPNKV